MPDFLYDAEHRTESWQNRHSPASIAMLGVWRWKGIQKHAGRICAICHTKRVVDFGGADGPFGFGSTIVDQKAKAKTLADVAGPIDVIFTSHTLEHIPDLNGWLEEACYRLTPGGCLIVHVPAYTCRRWRAGEYNNPAQPNGHVHTFTLHPDKWENAVQIDKAIDMAGFYVGVAEYCGDDSIIIFARKP